MDWLEFSWRPHPALPGTDRDPHNPLSRALRVPVELGRPHRAHSLLYFRPSNGPVRWFGVFIYSEGNRVLFFPGLLVPITWVGTAAPGRPYARKTFNLDHISLEPFSQRWHFTSEGSSDHIAGGRMPSVGEDRLLCLGLSLASDDVLRPALKETIVGFHTPPSDAERRLALLDDAHSTSHSTYFRAPKRQFETAFLHITLVLAPSSAAQYTGPEWLLPYGGPFAKLPQHHGDAQVAKTLNRIPITEALTAQVACMWLPGQLTADVAYTSPSELKPSR